MKTINTYINEKLRLSAKPQLNEKLQLSAKPQYTCQPKDKKELQQIIIRRIKNEGNDCDLNDIDVSKITDMSHLFSVGSNEIFRDFNGDISLWDVSNVETMNSMFFSCEKFNCDLSKWNICSVKNIGWVFYSCYEFNCDLSKWDVSNVEYMAYAFYRCPTQPTWYDKDKYE